MQATVRLIYSIHYTLYSAHNSPLLASGSVHACKALNKIEVLFEYKYTTLIPWYHSAKLYTAWSFSICFYFFSFFVWLEQSSESMNSRRKSIGQTKNITGGQSFLRAKTRCWLWKQKKFSRKRKRSSKVCNSRLEEHTGTAKPETKMVKLWTRGLVMENSCKLKAETCPRKEGSHSCWQSLEVGIIVFDILISLHWKSYSQYFKVKARKESKGHKRIVHACDGGPNQSFTDSTRRKLCTVGWCHSVEQHWVRQEERQG